MMWKDILFLIFSSNSIFKLGCEEEEQKWKDIKKRFKKMTANIVCTLSYSLNVWIEGKCES